MKQCFLMMWAAFALAGCAGETNTATRLQEELLQWKFGLFLHFNIATFNNPEWANCYDRPVARSCRPSACRKLASCSEPRRPDLDDHHCNWT